MSTRNFCMIASIVLAVLHRLPPAVAQQPATESPPGVSPASKHDPSADSDAANERAQIAAILDSDRWRRAMFERDQWLRTQTVFGPDEVERIKADFAARVDAMSAEELRRVLGDLEAKSRILDTQEARDARASFGRDLARSVGTRRERLLAEIPDIATITPAQLNELIARFERRRASRAAFHRNRQAQVDAQLQSNRAAQQAFVDRRSRQSAYRSPYRPPARERPFENAQIGPRRSMAVDPYGQIWMNIGQ